jgi:hypothetical protein
VEIEISNEDSTYMYDLIEEIINKCGPRMPCSPQEHKAATLIRNEMDKTCDSSETEKFHCHPRAFLGFIRVIIVLTLVSFILFFLLPLNLPFYWILGLTISSFILSLLSILILWNEFFNYREFIDPLFKRKESQNVIGKFKPNGELKKILIFSGHHDSALQFNLLKSLKIGYPIMIFVGLIVLFLWFITSGLIFILSFVYLYAFQGFFIFSIVLFIIGIPPLISLFFFVSSGEKANKVPGAVDNLSAVGIVLGLGRYLQKNKHLIPNNTEIRLISFGCEEAGLRGAYRYVERHLDELMEYNAECVNMDAIQTPQSISIINFEPSTRTKHSEIVVNKLIKAAQNAEINIKSSSLGGSGSFEKIFGQITGGTDATAFSKSNIKAANISAMNLKKMLEFYHQPGDTPDKIEKGALENVLKICLNYIILED